MSSSLRVVEQFESVQGEGGLVGTPSRFIRLSGCNLRCVWCDTPESSWAPTGEHVEIDQLVRACAEGPRHVVLTGGEPMLFEGSVALCAALRAAGHHVTVETAGTRWLEGLEADLMSISPKLAHSTPWSRDRAWAERHEAARFDPPVLRRLLDAYPWQLKYVVRANAQEQDLEEIESQLEAMGIEADRREHVFLMPECIDPERLGRDYAALWPTCRARGFRLGERLHLHMFGHGPGT